MYFISLLIVINLGFSYCFVFYQHRDELELENDVSYMNKHANISVKWIEQPLDHFSTRNETWKMRYYQRLDFWRPNGPIYLYINRERPAISKWIQKDSLFTCQLANETNGALFESEHRYYGQSKPFADIKDVSSMKYLSSKQALADLATLIKFIKSAPEFKMSKVVVIGESFAGNLAAWMRVIYPDLVDAAVSSSAPVLAKKEFYENLETVGDVYNKYGSTACVNEIKSNFKQFVELLKTSSGIETLKREFNICYDTDMSVVENQQLFFDSLVSEYEANAKYGTPGLIKSHCQSLQTENWARSMQKSVDFFFQQFTFQYRRKTSSSMMKKLFQVKNWTEITTNSNEHFCSYSYDFKSLYKFIKSLKNEGMYSLNYQVCTEYGDVITTTSNKQPFPHSVLPLDYNIKYCQGIFGEDFNEKRIDDGVAQTNAMYGGITPNVTNVVFTHGDMDPWHRLGVLKDLSETAVVRITNGTSQCALLRIPDPSDPDALTKDREYVKNMIKKWIKNN